MQNIKEMLLEGNVIFNNSKLFRWYLNNVKLIKDRNDNWLPQKQTRSRKIDGFAALLDAHCEVVNKLISKKGDEIKFMSFD